MLEGLEQRQLLAAVVSTQFDYAQQGQYVNVNLNAAAPGSLATALQVRSLTQDTAVAMNYVGVSNGGQKITWATASKPLPNGWYEAYVNSPLLDGGEHEQTFAFMNADFDGNHVTDFNDYMILQNNWNQTGKGFSGGDADYNGVTDFNDFGILQNNYNRSLPNLPSQPGGVVVGNAVADALDVGWTSNTDPRDGFKVYRSTDGVNFTLVQTLADPDARSWRDATVVNGVKYWYRVRAYTNAAGASASVTKAWGIATHPTPIATGLAAAGIGPGRIALIWKAPADTAVVKYRIYRSKTPGFLPSAATLVTETDQRKTKIIDSGLSPGHTYYYKIVTVGANGSTSLPSAEVAAVAQNQGPGLSNSGTPFDPQTHDSDNDGTPDAQDTDNDNDGITDEADSDDDNDGTSDNAEPDDRDSDGDGQSDNDDSDDDNDGTPDSQDEDDDDDGTDDEDDASTGDNDGVPTGPGAHVIFTTHGNAGPNNQLDYFTQGYTPKYIDFSYTNELKDSVGEEYPEENGPTPPEEEPRVQPRRSFYQDHVNDTQTFKLSNLPEHSVVTIGGTIEGGGWLTTDPNNPGTGEIEIEINGESVEYDTPGGWPQFYFRFGKTIESESGKVEVTFKGKNFNAETGSWFIQNLGMSVAIPQYDITGYASDYVSTEQDGTKHQTGSITISRTHDYKDEEIDMSELLNSVSDGDLEGLPSTVQFEKGVWSITYQIDRVVHEDSDGGVLVLEMELPDIAIKGAAKFNEEEAVKNLVLPFLAVRNGQIHTQLAGAMIDAGREYSDPQNVNGGKNGLPTEEGKARLMKVAGVIAQGQAEALGDLGFKLINAPAKLENALRALTGLAPAAENIVKELEFMKQLGKRGKLAEKLRQALNAKDADALTTLKEWRWPLAWPSPTGTYIQPEGFLAYTVKNRGTKPGAAQVTGSVTGMTPDIVTATGAFMTADAVGQSNVGPAKFNGTIDKDNANELIPESVTLKLL